MSTDEHVIPVPETKGSFDPRKQEYEDRSGMGALKVIIIGLAIVAAAGIGYTVAAQGNTTEEIAMETATARKGNLTVSVTEGGLLYAMEQEELKNEVKEGWQRTIVSIVDEGIFITEEDVENKKVLVELDSSDLVEKKSSRQISFFNAESALEQAEQALVIQEKMNESNVARATLNLKFAKLELARYLGAELAAQINDGYDFTSLGDKLALVATDETVEGGMGLQELREHGANVLLAEADLANQEEELKWTRDLEAEGFVTRQQLTADELQRDQFEVTRDSAKEQLRLFMRYDLPKEAERLYSDVAEAGRELDRVDARARSELAQKQADLRSKKESFELETSRLAKVTEMLEKCIIIAPVPGQVVYASTTSSWGRSQAPMAQGATVNQNQAIIVIPDRSSLAARVNIHETDVRKVKVGQRATVSLEAMPGETFSGTVKKVSPTASSVHAWLNPEIKVYETDVALEDIPDGMTPGMTATAEVIVAELKDVVYVPIDAVTTYRGETVCLIEGQTEPRTVEAGESTEKFVEIRSGLQAGDVVYRDPGKLLDHSEYDSRTRTIAVPGSEPGAAEAPETPAGAPDAPGAEAPSPAAPPVQGPQPAAEAAEGWEQDQGDGGEATDASAQTDEGGQVQYVVDGRINWRVVGAKLREMEALSEEEREKEWQAVLDSVPEEQRAPLEEMRERRKSMTPEEREQARQRRGGGQGGGQGGWNR